MSEACQVPRLVTRCVRAGFDEMFGVADMPEGSGGEI
jgi:hypothetical protein